jgi:hypothetical protein
VTQGAWRERCSCPSAARAREMQDRADELKQDVAGIAAEMRSSGPWDAEVVERRLREVYLSHEEAAPLGLTGWSRLVAAANARTGTRTPRLLWMSARGIVEVVRWAWRPAGPHAQTEHNRAEARAGFRSVGAMAAVATTATLAASKSSGWPRRLWAAAATVTWLGTGSAGVLVTGVTALSRLTEEAPGGGEKGVPKRQENSGTVERGVSEGGLWDTHP